SFDREFDVAPGQLECGVTMGVRENSLSTCRNLRLFYRHGAGSNFHEELAERLLRLAVGWHHGLYESQDKKIEPTHRRWRSETISKSELVIERPDLNAKDAPGCNEWRTGLIWQELCRDP